jgi:molybdopterin biosynthesis enzyme
VSASLPGFVRSTVDGYAVRAADIYGDSGGSPSSLPVGADAVVMVEYTKPVHACLCTLYR